MAAAQAAENHASCVPPPFLLAGGGLNLLPNFQKQGGLTEPQFLERVTFSGGGGICNFYVKIN